MGKWVGILWMMLAGGGWAAELPVWNFDSALGQWVANGDLANVKVARGGVQFDARGDDGFLHDREMNFAATPWQYVWLRLKADRGGQAELFWSGTLTGRNGGLTQSKSQYFQVNGDGQWHEYVVLPGWQSEGTIHQLRFDVYAGAHFTVAAIEVRQWGGPQPLTGRTTFAPGGEGGLAALNPGSPYLMAPPLRLPVERLGWVAVRARTAAARRAAVLWTAEGMAGLARTPFTLRGDGATHTYNIKLAGNPAWRGNLIALGLEWPAETPGPLAPDSLTLGAEPLGPPEISFEYVGFENAINRPGRQCRVLAKVINQGAAAGPLTLTLGLPAGLRPAGGPLDREVRGLDYGESEDVFWPVIAERDGIATVTVSVRPGGPGAPPPTRAGLAFDPPLTLPRADYVPPPRPIETVAEVCAYYFPGWESAAKWQPVRRVAPIRKPLLGWYDEANPECVDWQIKWARENGISCFLLDWYWNKGAQHLEHWLAAYKRARYRDQLKIAIMWANHNPPGSHSREDWRRLTQWWIDNVFALPGYFKPGGLPAVFVWAPDRARSDLGGSGALKEALAQSQAQARAAGYSGIAFLAVNDNETPAKAARLAGEGFVGATNYHEFAQAPARAPSRAEVRFEDLVATAPGVWEQREKNNGGLTYYPLLDSGWDARPWHGDNTMVMSGRTPELWESLLRAGLRFQREHPKAFVVLGPANEWGEGSYLEPNLEFGFGMYEKVRRVFGKGDPATWPQNYGPADVGRGPYDLE